MAHPSDRMRFDIQGTAVILTHDTREDMIGALIEAHTYGQGAAVATINLDHVVKLYQNPVFRQAYGAHDIVVADGNPMVWLSRIAGRPVSLVTGSDSIAPLCATAAEHGWSVALVGGQEDTLEAAKAHLIETYPDVKIPLCIAPPMGFDPLGPEAHEILSQLHAGQIDLCLVALGAPKQEIFAAYGRGIAPQTCFVSIGASLDFLAGTQQRAPLWVQQIKCEWLWRMLGDPTRLVPRYAKCAIALPWLIYQALRLR